MRHIHHLDALAAEVDKPDELSGEVEVLTLRKSELVDCVAVHDDADFAQLGQGGAALGEVLQVAPAARFFAEVQVVLDVLDLVIIGGLGALWQRELDPLSAWGSVELLEGFGLRTDAGLMVSGPTIAWSDCGGCCKLREYEKLRVGLGG
jgi:hypothetical protein